jgi:hypothetical protein
MPMRCGGLEPRAASRYRLLMPNRKTFDPRERYDHSGRPLEHAKKNDLKPDISEEAPAADPRKTRSPGDKPPAGG